MTLEEFKKSINLRSIERCCATCNYGDQEYDGEWRCYIPELVGIHKFGQGWFMEIRPKFLCDKWRKVERS